MCSKAAQQLIAETLENLSEAGKSVIPQHDFNSSNHRSESDDDCIRRRLLHVWPPLNAMDENNNRIMDIPWLEELLRTSQYLLHKNKEDWEVRRWVIQHKDAITRRINDLRQSQERKSVVYKVKHEPYPLRVSSSSNTAKASDNRRILAFPREGHPSPFSKCRGDGAEDLSSKEKVSWMYPNRSFYSSDIICYPHLEITNTIGLEEKNRCRCILPHKHRCFRCGTAVPSLHRYFAEVDSEFLARKERKFIHEGSIGYQYQRDVAKIVNNCMSQLHSDSSCRDKNAEIKKDLVYRWNLSDAGAEVLSSVHRLRQEGCFNKKDKEGGQVYPMAYDHAHLRRLNKEQNHHSGAAKILLPPVTRGDGHEGSFYL